MKARVLKLILATTAFAFTLSACSDTEAPAGHSHAGIGEAVRRGQPTPSCPSPTRCRAAARRGSEVHYYDADGEDITDELIAEHFTSLIFDPGTFATSDLVTDAKFQRDVLVNAAIGRHGEPHGWLRSRRDATTRRASARTQ